MRKTGGNAGRAGNKASDAMSVRPWTANLTADRPGCHQCTWVRVGAVWKLKFVHRACRQHKNLG